MIFHIIKRDTDEIVKSLPNYNGAGPKILNSFEAADFIGILFGFRAKKHADLLGRGIAGEGKGATIEKGVTTKFSSFDALVSCHSVRIVYRYLIGVK